MKQALLNYCINSYKYYLFEEVEQDCVVVRGLCPCNKQQAKLQFIVHMNPLGKIQVTSHCL